MRARLSLASWPGWHLSRSAELIARPPIEPILGQLLNDHVQLVPQSLGLLDERTADALTTAYPATRFRLHANVRVSSHHVMADLSNFAKHGDWFKQAARISRRLDAPAYTAHAGRRCNASLVEILESARQCSELFECPVGVEGHYPTAENTWLVSTWDEYQQLFESGVPYALDLSHLNILATQTGRSEDTLVLEMLDCERCIEIHVSDNDGLSDRHDVCQDVSRWSSLLRLAHPSAVIFSEGNHKRMERRP